MYRYSSGLMWIDDVNLPNISIKCPRNHQLNFLSEFIWIHYAVVISFLKKLTAQCSFILSTAAFDFIADTNFMSKRRHFVITFVRRSLKTCIFNYSGLGAVVTTIVSCE